MESVAPAGLKKQPEGHFFAKNPIVKFFGKNFIVNGSPRNNWLTA